MFFPFSRRMEKRAQSMPQAIAHACAARTQIRSLYELHVAGSLHDDEQGLGVSAQALTHVSLSQ